MSPETTRTFEFERKLDNGDFYVGDIAVICADAIKELFNTKASRIRLVGTLTKPKGKGWRKARMDKKTEIITISGRKFSMLWSLEFFLDTLGVGEKPFYVKLEK